MTSRWTRSIAAALLTILLVVAAGGAARATASTGASTGTAFGSVAVRSGSVRPAIVGGSSATPGAFPWLAFITIGDRVHECTGTVISPDLILTAGHCVYDIEAGRAFDPAQMRVTTGTTNWAQPAERQVSRVLGTWTAPGYDPGSGDRDAAILQLARPTTAPAIALADPTETSLLRAATPVVIAGWGLTDPADPTSLPDTLQWAGTAVQSSNFCGARMATFDPSGELCTIDGSAQDTSVCNGDSGGPVIADDYSGQTEPPTEIGVIDSSADCSGAGPNYSARVDSLYAWAQQLIGDVAPSGADVDALGTLSLAESRADVRVTLTRGFGRAFVRGRGLRAACQRRSSVRVACRVAWSHGSTAYHGRVTIRLGRKHGRVVWRSRYGIRASAVR